MSKIGKCFKMSKLDSLVSVMERAEKQALALFLVDESKQNDLTALSMLQKRGIPEPEQVLELLKQITVDGTENGQPVWSLSNTGKEIQPLAGWYCSTWNEGDDAVQARERVADTVHKMYRIPSARNQDLTKVWLANKELTNYEEWVNKAYEQDKAKGKIVDAEKGEVVDVGAYEFPKKMLAYSDDKVDCYRADTPADAMLLGDGYPFCISRRDGSNMFYSYRMNPTTTAYFCWFKDKNGNKTKKNMVVVHVGEDDRYMVTKSENGAFPRDSKDTTIEKYPALKGAIESGKLTVVPMSDEEKEVRQKYSYRSDIKVYDLEGKSPKYIELVLAQGVKLTDDAFDYIFNNIDNGNLRTGNNGNSLIKKYVESGIHRLTPHQKDVLKSAGYENELGRSMEVWCRGHMEEDWELYEFEHILSNVDKGDIEKEGSLIKGYIIAKGKLSPEEERVLSEFGDGSVFNWYKNFTVNVSIPNRIRSDFSGDIRGNLDKDGYYNIESDNVLRISGNAYRYISIIKSIKGVEKLELQNFQYGIPKDFPELPENISISITNSWDVSFHFIKKKIEELSLRWNRSFAANNGLENVKCDELDIEDLTGHNYPLLNIPQGLKKLSMNYSSYNEKGCIDLRKLPRKMEELNALSGVRGFITSGFKGIPEEIKVFKTVLNDDIKDFPKKIDTLYVLAAPKGNVTEAMSKCIIGQVKVVGYGAYTNEFRTFVLDKVQKTSLLDRGNAFVKVEESGGFYDIIVEKGGTIKYVDRPDKPVKKLVFSEYTHHPCGGIIELGRTVDFNDLPYKVSYTGGGNEKSIILSVDSTLYDTLTLRHEVEGITTIKFETCSYLKKIVGLRKFKGLKGISFYGCPEIRKYRKEFLRQVPKGVYVEIDGGLVKESLSLYSLSMVLDNLMD